MAGEPQKRRAGFMLKIHNLTFRYQNSEPLYQFDLEAQPGEIIGIQGESGSGKSTLLDLLTGFLMPLDGAVFWQDENIVPLPPEHRPVNIVFQRNNLFEHLTAEHNVRLGLGPSENSKGHDIVYGALARVGLAGKELQKASTLSGGQQQRVALARAIVRNKPLLLLDEPFNGLDESNREDMLSLIKGLAENGDRTVLMVTHEKSDCEAIASRSFIVDEGQLTESRG